MSQLPNGSMGRVTVPRSRQARSSTSVIGLVPDPLAPLYPEGAPLILRFDDLDSLMRDVLPTLQEVATLLPSLGLPAGDLSATLHWLVSVPVGVRIDTTQPFALVPTADGWAAILPTRDAAAAPERLRALDGEYCVAGDPKVLDSYAPGFRKGFYLPGNLSVLVRPDAVGHLGSILSSGGKTSLSWLDGRLGPVPPSIERIDLSFRVGPGGLRADLRLAPDPESPVASFLDGISPQGSESSRWLPSNGALYVELTTAASCGDELVRQLLGLVKPPARGVPARSPSPLRSFLDALGHDAAAMVQLSRDGSGSLVVVSEVGGSAATSTYFGSAAFAALLDRIAGPGSHLEWVPEAYERQGVSVGAVTGNISRTRLQEWMKGDPLETSLGVLLRGPVVVYVATVGGKLCLVAGQNSRPAMDRFLDHLANDATADNDHSIEAGTLFPYRIAAATVDLAALFGGCREAAPYWLPEGRALQDLSFPSRLPVGVAVTVEGGAIRCAVRVRPALLAEAAARVREALRDADASHRR